MKFTKETWRRVGRTMIQVGIPIFLENIALLRVQDGKNAIINGILSACVLALSAGIAAWMNAEKAEDE